MGYILKQDKAITIQVCQALISKFLSDASGISELNSNKMNLINGLVYTVIMFCCSLRGSEGLKLDLQSLRKHFNKGDGPGASVPHVVIPLRGRFKGKKGERHLIPVANETESGIKICESLALLLAMRLEHPSNNPWAFINFDGSKTSFAEMNKIVLERLEQVKDEDVDNSLDIPSSDSIRELYSL